MIKEIKNRVTKKILKVVIFFDFVNSYKSDYKHFQLNYFVNES